MCRLEIGDGPLVKGKFVDLLFHISLFEDCGAIFSGILSAEISAAAMPGTMSTVTMANAGFIILKRITIAAREGTLIGAFVCVCLVPAQLLLHLGNSEIGNGSLIKRKPGGYLFHFVSV